jgi:hypothetical protein
VKSGFNLGFVGCGGDGEGDKEIRVIFAFELLERGFGIGFGDFLECLGEVFGVGALFEQDFDDVAGFGEDFFGIAGIVGAVGIVGASIAIAFSICGFAEEIEVATNVGDVRLVDIPGLEAGSG